jgi:hypothetical protein
VKKVKKREKKGKYLEAEMANFVKYIYSLNKLIVSNKKG